jgi:hypothetical protein
MRRKQKWAVSASLRQEYDAFAELQMLPGEVLIERCLWSRRTP